MRYLLRVIAVLWALAFIMVGIATSGFFHSECPAALEFEVNSLYLRREFRRYDFHIGLSYYRYEALRDTSTYSPDGRYSYDESQRYTVNDYNVFLVNNETLERQLVFGSPFVFAVFWSQDSRSLLIWEHDGNAQKTTLSSYDIESLTLNFQHDLDAIYPIGQSPDKRYIYAQFFLDETHSLRGVLFIDSITGEITRFEHPSDLHYVWSDDSRWVASQYHGRVFIIDPTTGDFHPDFAAPIQGVQFIWQDDNLWFTRLNSSEGNSVWRVSLSSASIDLMIRDARLEALSNDGQWAYIYDGHAQDMAIVDVGNDKRHLLQIGDMLSNYRDNIRFLPDAPCAALIMTRDSMAYEIRVYNLLPFHQSYFRRLEDTLLSMNWVRSRR